MARVGKRHLLLLLALAAVLAGGTAAALGATGSGNSRAHHRGQHRRVHASRGHAGRALRNSLRAAESPGITAARHGHLQVRAIVRSYLGLSRQQLRSQLRAGRTLAQIADATPGHSAAGLREAILAALRARLDGKVSAHALSRGAEQHRLSHLQAKVGTLLNRTHPARPAHRHKRAA